MAVVKRPIMLNFGLNRLKPNVGHIVPPEGDKKKTQQLRSTSPHHLQRNLELLAISIGKLTQSMQMEELNYAYKRRTVGWTLT